MPNANSFADGQRGRVRRDDTARVGAYAASVLPLRGPGVTGRQFPQGTTIVPPLGRRGGSQAAADFSLYDASGAHAAEGGLWVGVRFGSVTCYSLADDTPPWPDNYTHANGYTCEFAVTTDGSVWIEVQNDTSDATNKVSNITLGHGTAPPTGGDPTTGYRTVGNWMVDTSVSPPALKLLNGAAANGIGNQCYNFCGGGHFFAP